VAARVVDYKPATTRPFAEVNVAITERLTQQQAAQLAAKHGRELLARLKRGESDTLAWGAPRLVSRDKAQDYTGPALIELFRVDTGKLPAYAGYESAQGGYTLLKVTRVVEVDAIDAAKRKAAADELRQLLGQEQLNAFVASLKLKADVKVQQDRLEKNPQ